MKKLIALLTLCSAAFLNAADILYDSFEVVFDKKFTVADAKKASREGELPGKPRNFSMRDQEAFNLKRFKPDATAKNGDVALISFVINAKEEEEIVLGFEISHLYTVCLDGKEISTNAPRGGGWKGDGGFYSKQNKVKLKAGKNYFVIHTTPSNYGWSVSIGNLSKIVKYGPYAYQIDRDSAVIGAEFRTPVAVCVRYWEEGKRQKMTFRNVLYGKIPRETMHRFVLTGLKPDTKYCYELAPVGGMLQGPLPSGTFKTAPASGTKHVFVAISDTQCESDYERPGLIRNFVKQGLFKDADVFASVGDLANYFNNFNAMYFDLFLKPFREAGVTAAFLPVRGNHEFRGVDTDGFHKWFGAPYYAVRHGDVLYIVLDTGEDKKNAGARTVTTEYFEEQRIWFENLVKSEKFQTAKVKIVLAHAVPSRFMGSYMSENVKHIIKCLLGEKPAGKIDLWISGHTHVPYRYDPVSKTVAGADESKITSDRYVLEWDRISQLPFPVYVNDGPGNKGKHYSVLRLEIDGKKIHLTCTASDRTLMDSIVIEQGKPFVVKKTTFVTYGSVKAEKKEEKKGK